MTDEERKALVAQGRDLRHPLQEWDVAALLDQIEADGKRIAELEAALNGLLDEITLNKGDVLDSRAAGMAYAALLLGGKQ